MNTQPEFVPNSLQRKTKFPTKASYKCHNNVLKPVIMLDQS